MTNKTPDVNILTMVIARLLKRPSGGDPLLGLEITAGEWKGVVFSFKTFEMMPHRMENNMVPTRYETAIHIIPNHFPPDWVPDERFDAFTSEVLFGWLSYIHMNDLSTLIKAQTSGTIQG